MRFQLFKGMFLKFKYFNIKLSILCLTIFVLFFNSAIAEDTLAGLTGGLPALTLINNSDGSSSYSLSLQILRQTQFSFPTPSIHDGFFCKSFQPTVVCMGHVERVQRY